MVQALALPPVEAFGSLPAISNVKLSPDGKHMAALQIYKGRTIAAIYDLGAPRGTMPALLADDARRIVDARWVNNERLLVITYDQHYERSTVIISVDTKAQNAVILPTAGVAGLNLDDPNHIYVVDQGRYGFRIDLYKLDITTGKEEHVLDGKGLQSGLSYTIGWIMDGHNPVARVDHDDDPVLDHIRVYRNGALEDAFDNMAEPLHGAHMIAVSPDGTKLVHFAKNAQTGTDALVTYDLATGKTEPLYSNASYDTRQLLVSEWNNRVIGAAYFADRWQVNYFEPDLQALQKDLESRYSDKNVAIVSLSVDRSRVVFRVSAPNDPPSYYFLNRESGATSRIASAYPGLTPQDLGTTKNYAYKARDGLNIPAYLTLPPGKSPKNLPVIVMPHGGPEARDVWDFDWWAQFLANRGYAVLQPNFRGSWGYGYAFTQAGFHQWGLKMEDDVSDGVAKLIADGVADPKRICIVGASYGGYAALAGAAFASNLYACAVSVAGVSNLPKMLDRTQWGGRHSEVAEFWVSRLGDTSDDRVRLKATSPSEHAEQIHCPVLLIHGEHDYVVPISQSQEIYKKLTALGRDVEFVRLEGEDHQLDYTETRQQMLSSVEAFLAKHLAPK